MNHDTKKPLTLRLLHWSVALLFAVAFLTAYPAFDFSANYPFSGNVRYAAFAIHRLSGMLAGLLLIVWLITRVSALVHWARRQRPIKVLATFHVGLGLACLVLPILPWIARSQEGRTVELYSILPKFNSMSPPTTNFVYKLLADHRDLANIILLLLALHVTGALFHHYIIKDRVLSRMWFGRN